MKSVYIHIPFCINICSYCDFTKIFYNESIVMSYLDSLKKEIEKRYGGEKIYTLYIGGGTPSSLSINELIYLFEIINKLDLSELKEFTFECNIDSLDREKLILLKKHGVNRLSLGIQSFNNEILETLGIEREKSKTFEVLDFIKQVGFYNVNLDLIYAVPNQTLEQLNEDLDIFLSLNPNHISCYSLMIEPHTKLYINKEKEIDEDLDYEMYRVVEDRLTSYGYKHYEISNYSKPNYESIHNNIYWDNEEYYGFGLGASSYLGDYRFDNTKNITKYLNNDYEDNMIYIKDDNIKYSLMLGFRKLKGINIEKFNKRYDTKIEILLNKHIKENKIVIEDGYIKIEDSWIYKMNEILIDIV